MLIVPEQRRGPVLQTDASGELKDPESEQEIASDDVADREPDSAVGEEGEVLESLEVNHPFS